jgi:RNA polymerase sigma-70 factor, ECF subfamily
MSEPQTPLAIQKSYDVFLSYAHTDAETAGRVTRAFVEVGLTVFDAFSESARLWGSDLYSLLSEIYPEQAHAAIVLFSHGYNASSWCRTELDLLTRRAAELPDSGVILPVRLDDAPVPTSMANLLYLDLRTTGVEELATLAKKRLEEWKEEQNELLARLTDDELMQRVATQRDTEAFGVLYERLYPLVRRYISEVVHAPDANDLASETMLTLWRKADRFDQTRGPLKSWLRIVARNAAIDHMRRQATQPLLGMFTDELPEAQSFDSSVLSQDLLTQLNDAMRILTEPEREVMALVLSGTPLSEIAQVLNVPVGAVRLRQHRAIKRLKKILGGVPKSK